VRAVAWDDPEFDWGSTRLALLRSPWDYYRRPAEFLAWAERTARRTRLENPLATVRWNLEKGYLVALARAGAPVVPTRYLPRGSSFDLAAFLAADGAHGAVVKPAVSADSWETVHVPPGEPAAGQAALDRLLPERAMLVQPYLPSVEDYGERCLVAIEGELSHAVRKNALTRGGRWAGFPEGTPVPIAEEERAAAGAVLDAARRVAGIDRPLYARIDLVRDAAGEPRLLELELAEPTLFLAGSAAGLARLTGAIAARLGAPSDSAAPESE
jgi:O-ureido-D-serine cyclo-ligase